MLFEEAFTNDILQAASRTSPDRAHPSVLLRQQRRTVPGQRWVHTRHPRARLARCLSDERYSPRALMPSSFFHYEVYVLRRYRDASLSLQANLIAEERGKWYSALTPEAGHLPRLATLPEPCSLPPVPCSLPSRVHGILILGLMILLTTIIGSWWHGHSDWPVDVSKVHYMGGTGNGM